MINALIVEDSELAREELIHLLKGFEAINIIAEAVDVKSAVDKIERLSPELVFMDIDLPGGNAFDILSRLEVVPAIIFTTAFDAFALQAYEYNTVDYLLKPIKKERLTQALDKLNIPTTAEHNSPPFEIANDGQFFIKDGEQVWLIKVASVRYLEAIGNYTRIVFDNEKPLHARPLNKIENRLDPRRFFRINRSQIVNMNHVERMEPWITGGLKIWLSCGKELDISRRQTTKFKELLAL
jgi:two-component system LytT family response regulator